MRDRSNKRTLADHFARRQPPAAFRHGWSEFPNAFGTRDPMLALLEAALLSADEPINPRKLARIVGISDTGETRRLVDRLNRIYVRQASPFYVEELAGGYQLLSLPQYRRFINRLYPVGEDLQLSESTLETLAIIAYRQPICKADVEAIRGVQSAESIKQTIDKGLVKIVGREETLGRPFLYGTTRRFLQVLGLRHLNELPMVEVLRDKPIAQPPVESLEEDESAEVKDS